MPERRHPRYGDTIHWPTALAIIGALHEHGPMKRTHVRMKCSMPYERCCRHLDYCETLDLVKTIYDEDDNPSYAVTGKGEKVYYDSGKGRFFPL